MEEEFLDENDIAQVLVVDENGMDTDDEMDNEMDENESETEGETDEMQELAPGEGMTGDEVEFLDDSIQGFFGHQEPVYGVAIHPTNPLIALSGGGDDRGTLWRMDTGETLMQLDKHTDSVVALGFSFDGSYFATGSMDGKIHVHDENGQGLLQLEGPSEVIWLNWHPKGPILLAGSEDGTVWMWQVPSGNCMHVFAGHTESSTCGQFTPDGKSIVTASSDGSLIVWDPKSGSALHRCSAEDGRFHQAPLTSLTISPDSSISLSGDNDGGLLLVSLKTGKILGSLNVHTDSVETLAFSSHLPYFATASVDGRIVVWDRVTFKQHSSMTHNDAVTKIKFHPTEPHLISASMDKTVRVWDCRTGECLKTLNGHQDPILDFDISFDGQIILTGSDDGTSLVFASS